MPYQPIKCIMRWDVKKGVSTHKKCIMRWDAKKGVLTHKKCIMR